MSKATFDIDPELQSKVKGSQIVPSGTMEEKVTKVAYRSTGQQEPHTVPYQKEPHTVPYSNSTATGTATSRKNYTVQYYVLYYSK